MTSGLSSEQQAEGGPRGRDRGTWWRGAVDDNLGGSRGERNPRVRAPRVRDGQCEEPRTATSEAAPSLE